MTETTKCNSTHKGLNCDLSKNHDGNHYHFHIDIDKIEERWTK